MGMCNKASVADVHVLMTWSIRAFVEEVPAWNLFETTNSIDSTVLLIVTIPMRDWWVQGWFIGCYWWKKTNLSKRMTLAKDKDLFVVAAASTSKANGNGGVMDVGRAKHAWNAFSKVILFCGCGLIEGIAFIGWPTLRRDWENSFGTFLCGWKESCKERLGRWITLREILPMVEPNTFGCWRISLSTTLLLRALFDLRWNGFSDELSSYLNWNLNDKCDSLQISLTKVCYWNVQTYPKTVLFPF